MEYPGKFMTHRFERVMLYSPEEYRRRIDGIVEIAKTYNVDAVLFPETAAEAFDEWLLGERFLECAIVRADGSAVGILPREAGLFRLGNGINPDRSPASPYCDGVTFLEDGDAKSVAALLAAGEPSRLGIVLPQQMPAALGDEVKRRISRVEWVDLTIPAAVFRAVKSPEEVYAIRQARDIQAAVYEALPQMLRVGRSVDEVTAEMKHLLREMGASGVVHGGLICYGQADTPCEGGFGMPDRRVAYGDRFFALMEANGPGHHHVAFGRHFMIGEFDEGWRRCVEDAIRVHRFAVSLMKPHSLNLAQIAEKTQGFANDLGYEMKECVGWNWMHSMGPYYYEQYSLEDYTDRIPLEENIMLHCHPLIFREYPDGSREDVFLLNSYLLGKDGAIDLVDIPMDPVSLYG